jgi:hypothetical protein
MVAVIGAFVSMRHGVVPIEKEPQEVAMIIEGLEEEIYKAGNFHFVIEELKQEVLDTRTRFAAVHGFQLRPEEKRIAIVDLHDPLDPALFKDLISENRKVFVLFHDFKEGGDLHYAELDANGMIPDDEDRIQEVVSFAYGVAEIGLDYPDYTINVISRDDDALSSVMSDDVELFSTKRAYQEFAELAGQDLSFESAILPFLLNVDTETLNNTYQGIYNLFIKRSRIWRVNPDYVASLSNVSLQDAYAVLTQSIKAAIRDALTDRMIKTAA